MLRFHGIRVGRILGIPVVLDPFLVMLVGLYAWLLRSDIVTETGDYSVLAILYALGTAVLTFVCVFAHELGHAVMARFYGIKTLQITMFLLGGIAHLGSEMKRPSQELMIAGAGPAVSLFLAGLFALPLYFVYGDQATAVTVCLHSLCWFNLMIGLFNVLVAGLPLDGGHMVRAAIWGLSGNFLLATRIASGLGIFFGAALGALGGMMIIMGMMGGLIFVMLGVYVMRGARQSYRGAAEDHAFRTYKVCDLMRPVQAVVPSHLSVKEVVRHFVTQLHADQFPVVRGSEVLGFISADEIASVDKGKWDSTSAESLTRPYPRENLLLPGMSVFTAYQRMMRTGLSMLPVLDGMQLCGFVFLRDVQRRLERHIRMSGLEGLRDPQG